MLCMLVPSLLSHDSQLNTATTTVGLRRLRHWHTKPVIIPHDAHQGGVAVSLVTVHSVGPDVLSMFTARGRPSGPASTFVAPLKNV
jgi:hypothetical protein